MGRHVLRTCHCELRLPRGYRLTDVQGQASPFNGRAASLGFDDRPELLKPLVRQRRRRRILAEIELVLARFLVSELYFQPSNRSKLPVDLFGRSS